MTGRRWASTGGAGAGGGVEGGGRGGGGGGGGGERGGRRAQRCDSTAQASREDLLQLDEGAHGGLLDAGHRCPRGRAKAHGDRDGLVVVEKQRGHRASRPQPVAAGGPRE